MNKVVLHKGLVMLDIKNPCQAEDLKQSSPIHHFLLKKYGASRFLFRASDYPKITEELAKKGYVPKAYNQ